MRCRVQRTRWIRNKERRTLPLRRRRDNFHCKRHGPQTELTSFVRKGDEKERTKGIQHNNECSRLAFVDCFVMLFIREKKRSSFSRCYFRDKQGSFVRELLVRRLEGWLLMHDNINVGIKLHESRAKERKNKRFLLLSFGNSFPGEILSHSGINKKRRG